VHNVRQTLGYGKELTFADGGCKLLVAPTSLGDLSAVGDGHSVFGGGGDLWNDMGHGSAGAKDGAMRLIDVTPVGMRKLTVKGAKIPQLIPHCIFYDQQSRRLYVVNHDEESGESAEVFKVASDASLDLIHIASVRDPLFKNFATNVVVSGVADEFYVTEWLPFGFPRGGKMASEWTLMQPIEKLLFAPINLFNTSTTRLFRCKLDAEPQCHVA